VHVPPEDHGELQRVAHELGVSVAEVVRQGVKLDVQSELRLVARRRWRYASQGHQRRRDESHDEAKAYAGVEHLRTRRGAGCDARPRDLISLIIRGCRQFESGYK
jgi:hypothetical protein